MDELDGYLEGIDHNPHDVEASGAAFRAGTASESLGFTFHKHQDWFDDIYEDIQALMDGKHHLQWVYSNDQNIYCQERCFQQG